MPAWSVKCIDHASRASVRVRTVGPSTGRCSTARWIGPTHGPPLRTASTIKKEQRCRAADDGQVDRQPAVADQAEAQRVDRLAALFADDAHDPDQEADDRHGDGQFGQRPGDRGQEVAAERDLVVVVLGQLIEDLALVPAEVADGRHLAEQRREVLAGGRHGLGHRVAAVDGLADGLQAGAGRGRGHVRPRGSMPCARRCRPPTPWPAGGSVRPAGGSRCAGRRA